MIHGQKNIKLRPGLYDIITVGLKRNGMSGRALNSRG